jgi:hypothetical protein
MKSVISLIGCTLFAFSMSAYAGQEKGGGDICEDRIKVIRDDLVSWIHQGGPKGLKLPSSVTVANYSQRMLEKLEAAKISCVGPMDKGYPVQINGTPKVCRFDLTTTESNITCDFLKFNATSESSQYVLIHHEYAGLAKLESPSGDDSKYFLSNQITSYLTSQVVKKLAVKPKPGSDTPGLGEVYTPKQACDLNIPSNQIPFNDDEYAHKWKTLFDAGMPFDIANLVPGQYYFASLYGTGSAEYPIATVKIDSRFGPSKSKLSAINMGRVAATEANRRSIFGVLMSCRGNFRTVQQCLDDLQDTSDFLKYNDTLQSRICGEKSDSSIIRHEIRLSGNLLILRSLEITRTLPGENATVTGELYSVVNLETDQILLPDQK